MLYAHLHTHEWRSVYVADESYGLYLFGQGYQGMTTAEQNEREQEQANTCLSESLEGLADCTPPISEPHSTNSQTERQPSNISNRETSKKCQRWTH